MSQLEDDFLGTVRLLRLPEPAREHHLKIPGKRNPFRLDFAWPDHRIAVEIEGGTWVRGGHNRGAGYESNCRKYNHATLQGWKLFRFTTGMVRSWEAARTVKEALENGQG